MHDPRPPIPDDPIHCWCCECEKCVPWGFDVPPKHRTGNFPVVIATYVVKVEHDSDEDDIEPCCDACFRDMRERWQGSGMAFRKTGA